MNKKIKILITTSLVVITAYTCYLLVVTSNPNLKHYIGQKLDSLNGVYVYYNGGVGHTGKRNTSEDGYNIGLTYQCVEFAKRYYYQFYHHKMPDAYGNAKDFFDTAIPDGKLNAKRNLIQYTNPSLARPQTGDFVIFDGHSGNPYGHVAIVSAVSESRVEIIQQNPGPFAASRVSYDLKKEKGKYSIGHNRLLGWLRMRPYIRP